jgi:acyl carrier protein
MPPQDDVFPRIRALIADSLAVDESTITPESRLIDELGADSLDFVDLTFAIEKAFGVRLRESELNFLARLDFSSPAVMQGGYLTRDTIASVRPLLPALDRVPDPGRVTPGELFSLLTVETLCLMIQRRLSI